MAAVVPYTRFLCANCPVLAENENLSIELFEAAWKGNLEELQSVVNVIRLICSGFKRAISVQETPDTKN